MTMTREDHLYSMRMQDLKAVADKLGIKINTKAAKSIAVEKILEAEKAADNWEKEADAEKAAAEKKQQDRRSHPAAHLFGDDAVRKQGTLDGERGVGKRGLFRSA